jgi:hypothetical protein
MLPSLPERNGSTEDTDILVLERALNWRAAPPLPWNCIASSLSLHVIALALSLAVLPGPFLEAPHTADASQAAVQRFVPLAFPAPPVTSKVVLGAAGRLDSPPIEAPDIAESKVAVNLNSIKLSFALDLRNQLPGVVEAQHGMLALLDKEDLGIAHYLMQPPEWKPRPVLQDISRNLRFRMDPAVKWLVFREAAGRYGINLDQYIACAVFDAAFGRCLKAAIESKVPPGAAGSVSMARLAFAADQPCGIEVLYVQLDRKSAPEAP